MTTLIARRSREAEFPARATGFLPLYQEMAGPIYHYCYRRLGTRELAEDATQLIFEKALRAYPRFRPGGSAKAWLFSIAHNTLIDYYRSCRGTADIADLPALAASGPQPEDEAIAHERLKELRDLMLRLQPQEQALLELRLAGFNDHEIADIVGKSHGSVRTMQYRSIHRLRELLGVETVSGDASVHARQRRFAT